MNIKKLKKVKKLTLMIIMMKRLIYPIIMKTMKIVKILADGKNQEAFKLDNEAENSDENGNSLNEEEINKIIQQKFKAIGKNLPETSNPPPQNPPTQLLYTQSSINTTPTPPLLQNTLTSSPVPYPPQFFPYQPFPYRFYMPQPQITPSPQQNTQPIIL